jgi:hypothetical protein
MPIAAVIALLKDPARQASLRRRAVSAKRGAAMTGVKRQARSAPLDP